METNSQRIERAMSELNGSEFTPFRMAVDCGYEMFGPKPMFGGENFLYMFVASVMGQKVFMLQTGFAGLGETKNAFAAFEIFNNAEILTANEIAARELGAQPPARSTVPVCLDTLPVIGEQTAQFFDFSNLPDLPQE